MYGFSSIFIYFLSIIIVISAMTFVVLMTLVHEVARRKQLIFLICFCACNFFIQLLYLGMTVQDVLIKYYRYSVILRVADITLYTLQSYIWCRYLLFYPLRHNSFAARHGVLACNIIAALTLVFGSYNYAFNIDNEFLYVNTAAVVIELGGTALISLMLILTVSGLKRGQNKRFDIYNVLITLLLIFIQLSTDICMIVETAVGFSFSTHEYLTGSLQQVLLTLMLALYVYRTDYSGASLRKRLIELAAEHAVNKNAVLSEDGNADVGNKVNGTIGIDDSLSHTYINDNHAVEPAAAENNSYAKVTSDAAVINEAAAGTIADVSAVNDDDDGGDGAVGAGTADDGVAGDGAAGDGAAGDGDGDGAAGDGADSAVGAAFAPATDAAPLSDDKLSFADELFALRQLTPREREVARLAYSGLTNPEIADRLCISQYTVKRHMHSIFEKLGISARIELVHLMSGHF